MNNELAKEHCRNWQVGENAYWFGVKGGDNPCARPIIRTFNSMRSAYDYLGLKTGHLSECCYHKYGKGIYKGYRWEFANSAYTKYFHCFSSFLLMLQNYTK